jgi:hypothetical protein
MYSSEYTSGFSGPAASHLAAPPSPRHERQCRTGSYQDAEKARQRPWPVTHEARDMRERRDVDRLNSHLVSPVPPVSLGYPAGAFPVAPDVPQQFPAA